MKVKSVNVGKLDRIVGGSMMRAPRSTEVGAASSSPHGDTASISSGARIIGLAGEAVRNAPEMRMERVQPIKDALESGRYDISSLDVADMILRRVLTGGKQFL